MARFARCEVFDPNEVAISHIFARVCRRCWLFGDDPVSAKNFDHRKGWIEASLHQLAAKFGVDLLEVAVISDHFHLILPSRPSVVGTWDERDGATESLLTAWDEREGATESLLTAW